MISNIGIPGLILILILALIIFGPQKLPQIGRAVGDSLREFRKSSKEVFEDPAERTEPDKENLADAKPWRRQHH